MVALLLCVRVAVADPVPSDVRADASRLIHWYHPDMMLGTRLEVCSIIRKRKPRYRFCWVGTTKLAREICAMRRIAPFFAGLSVDVDALKQVGRSLCGDLMHRHHVCSDLTVWTSPGLHTCDALQYLQC